MNFVHGFFISFCNEMKCTAYSRAERSSSALDAFSCKQSLIFACRLNYPAKLHAATACRFLCAFRTPLQKLCRRVRRLRSRLPLASNFSLFSCRQQLYGLFCHRSLSAAVLFVLVFQLYNIVDFLLIHRSYGFIVQFLMINTGNGGSFVQL